MSIRPKGVNIVSPPYCRFCASLFATPIVCSILKNTKIQLTKTTKKDFYEYSLTALLLVASLLFSAAISSALLSIESDLLLILTYSLAFSFFFCFLSGLLCAVPNKNKGGKLSFIHYIMVFVVVGTSETGILFFKNLVINSVTGALMTHFFISAVFIFSLCLSAAIVLRGRTKP